MKYRLETINNPYTLKFKRFRNRVNKSIKLKHFIFSLDNISNSKLDLFEQFNSNFFKYYKILIFFDMIDYEDKYFFTLNERGKHYIASMWELEK